MAEEFTSNPKNVQEWNRMWESGKYDPMHDPGVSKFITGHYGSLVSDNEQHHKKIFFPLCGKDVGMKWLADRGHEIVGVDGSAHAVNGFFTDQSLEFTKTRCEAVQGELYTSEGTKGKIRIYCCDLFDFSSDIENSFDAVWDRGSFGAMEPEDRERYTNAMLKEGFLKPACRYFIETFEGEPDEGLVSESLLKSSFKIGERFDMTRIEYEKDPDSSTEEWVMMVQVHLLKGIQKH